MQVHQWRRCFPRTNEMCLGHEIRLKIHYWNAAPSTSQTHLRRWRTYRRESLHERSALTVDTSEDRLRWLRMREDMRWKIWDELRARGSKATIQNSRACGTDTMVYTPAFRETEVSVQKPVYGRGMICMLSSPELPLWGENPERYPSWKRLLSLQILEVRTILWIRIPNSVNPKGQVLAAWCFRPQNWWSAC